jgi:hypothetical protein
MHNSSVVLFNVRCGAVSYNLCVSGFSPEVIAARDWWWSRFGQSVSIVPEEPPGKQFKPKFPMLPVLSDYSQISSDDFWNVFPVNFIQPAKSNICADKLVEMAGKSGLGQDPEVLKVVQWVRHGAEIGCKGRFRAASVSKNTKGAYAAGRQVSDAIAAWVKQGYAFGPVEEDDVPAHAKINSILTRTKPNGSVRIILNLSAPRGFSVNDGIDKDDFPAKMSSTEAWLAVLNRAGRSCSVMKIDFADAYKHVPVAAADTDLQWFEWGGKYFKELCLIFGASSSAGIFDATAKVILRIVAVLAAFPVEQVCQHLDDICAAAAAEETASLERFDRTFHEVAAFLGVKLASRDDPDKSFRPCKKGVVFGVEYDTLAWTWSIPHEKWARLVLLIMDTLERDCISGRQAKSLVGKLIHIKALLPAAKFNIGHIMRLAATPDGVDLDKVSVAIDAQCKRQLAFWLVLLKACPGNVSIPSPTRPVSWAKQVFTDAAGGSTDRLGAGTGGVCGSWWYYVPWERRINAGGWRVDGMKVGRKLSALELVGPLIAVVAGADWCANSNVTCWVDNAGSVAIWQKGYSTRCRLSSTVVTTINAVAAAIGCSLHIVKVTRCSCTGAVLADALSKGEFARAKAVARANQWPLQLEPAAVPVSLLSWIAKPVPDDDLADRILRELAATRPILNYSV